jgi:4-amino-4-deoxy-L-arabinose transferase-like glycosyltransferase
MTGPRQSGERLAVAALLGILALAFGVRLAGWERVFVGGDTVVFATGDAWYQVRRALYSFEHFPRVLWFDPCIGHPDGAVVSYPPLYHLGLAALARATGAGRAHLERVAAFAPVVLGALTVLPVYGIARAFAGRGVALGAALLYALLPIGIVYSRVGNADHHAGVALLGALLLWLFVRALDPAREGAALARAFAGLAGVRAALLLTWNGSLLYPGLGELALLAAGCVGARRALLGGQLASALATAALVAPVVMRAPVPPGGPWSATELSWLHLAAYLGLAGTAGGVLAWERLRPARSGGLRLARAAAVAAALALLLLLVPAVREGVARALAFVGQEDTWTSRVAENLPLFYAQGTLQRAAGEGRMGGFAYLIPLLPLAFALRAREPERAARARLLVAWTTLFGALAWMQVRYANDFAPAACAGFALLLAALAGALARRGLPARAAAGVALALGAALFAPALTRFWIPFATPSVDAARGRLPQGDRALLSVEGTQLRFVERVAALSPPETSCLAQEARPAAGVLAHPTLGHVLHYVAGRATPADPFGPYGVRETYLAAMQFLDATDESVAVQIAERLRTPWVVSSEEGWMGQPTSVAGRLQRDDGIGRVGFPNLGRFRLLSEAPRGGVPLSIVFESRVAGGPYYKLWEIVPGALLEVPVGVGERLSARLPLQTPSGRRFEYRASAVGGPDGVARLRVPYASAPRPTEPAPGLAADLAARTFALGPWRLRSGARAWAVDVSEQAVAAGETLAVGAAQGAGRPAARHTGPSAGGGRGAS